MAGGAISRFPVPRLEELPEDVRARILEAQQKSSFTPNVFLALAHRPAEWRARSGFRTKISWTSTGFSALSNRLANLSSMRPNDEFYRMGRIPEGQGLSLDLLRRPS